MQKALKTANSEKFVFSCQTSNVVPEPPNSLVFGRNQAPDVWRALDSVFSPEKQANSSRFVAARFWVEKSAQSGPVPEFWGTSFFAGFSTARQPAEDVTVCHRLCHRSVWLRVWCKKGLKLPTPKSSFFRVSTVSGTPEPLVSLVFGRKQARGAHFALDSAFSPENRRIPSRRACRHLSPPLSPLRFWCQKCSKRL